MSLIQWIHTLHVEQQDSNEFKTKTKDNPSLQPTLLEVSAFGSGHISINEQPFDFYMNQCRTLFFYLIHHRHLGIDVAFQLSGSNDYSDTDEVYFERILMQEINLRCGGDLISFRDNYYFLNSHKHILYDVNRYDEIVNLTRRENNPEVASTYLKQALEFNHADYLTGVSGYWIPKIRKKLRVERINLIYRLIQLLKQLQEYDSITYYRELVNSLQNE